MYSDRCNHLSGHHADMLLFIKHNNCHHHRVLRFFVVIAMLYTSIGIGIGYWVEANIIGYWILGAFLGIVLTLVIYVSFNSNFLFHFQFRFSFAEQFSFSFCNGIMCAVGLCRVHFWESAKFV